MNKEATYYVISYRDTKDKDNKVISLKARKVTDSMLGLSFICISDFVFETSSLLLNPTDENLKKRFENTKSLHLSIYSIISIEEVGADNIGLNFKNDKSKILVLPSQEPN